MGLAKETTFNTPVPAAYYQPILSSTLEPDPQLFYPPVIQGQRDLQIYALYGASRNMGDIVAPFFPSGAQLLKSAVGVESATTGMSPSNATVLATTLTAGATSMITSGSFTPLDIVQIDSNGSLKSECRKVLTVSGGPAPYTVTFDTAVQFSHSGGAAVAKVIAPFTHTFSVANLLDSLTIEKNIGGLPTSQQYPGCRVAKLDFSCEAANRPVELTANIEGKQPVVISATTPTWAFDTPFTFAEASVTLYGAAANIITDLKLTLDNGVKPQHTLQNVDHSPTFIPAVSLKTSGTLKAVFQSNDDANVGFFTKSLPPLSSAVQSGVQGNLNITWTHVVSGYALTFLLPQVNLARYGNTLSMTDVVITDLAFEASYSTGSSYSIQVQVTNSQYANY